ncbi:MAG: DUF86 domain-containing protein [Xanthomonadales bacterium]|nr:DUF86 domain-containing protein [Xanthomonadales bacterium]
MASIVLERKLDSLHRCLERIKTKCPADVEALAHDADLQDILVLNLSRAVQLCVDMATHTLAETGAPIPETMGSTFDQLANHHMLDAALAERLRKAVGFRNIAVHNYEAINWAIVYTIATEQLEDFRRFAQVMLQSGETTDAQG